MFSLLRIIAFPRRNYLKRDSTTLSSIFAIRSFSSNSSDQKSFTVSYLMNSCGLSEENAISASKKVKFENPTNPDSVLNLFRDHGFPDTHITKIIQKFPPLLVSSVDKTLKPKFDFFKSKGLSGPQLAKALSVRPFVLRASLEKSIIPSFDSLASFFQTDSEIISLLQLSMEVLMRDPGNTMLTNLKLLQVSGVPDSNILYLLASRPRSLLKTAEQFSEIVENVKEMGIDPSQCLFVLVIKVLTTMTKSTLEAKFDVYRRWGWSEEEIQSAFCKQPYCMIISKKKIMGAMEYLVKKIGYDSSLIAKHPGVLLYSLERRIVPRCSVIQVLIQNGLVDKTTNLYVFLNRNENRFLQNFVTKFESNVPDLLKVYQGRKMNGL